MMPPRRSGIEISTALLRPPDAEALLKRLRVAGTCCTQESPDAQAKVIDGALEVTEAFRGHFAVGKTGFDCVPGAVELSQLLYMLNGHLGGRR